MSAAIWTLIGVVMAGLISLAVEARTARTGLRAGMDGLRIDLQTELRSEIGGLRGEMAQMRTELRTEFQTEMGALRTEFRTELVTLRTENRTETGSIRAEIGGLRTDVQRLAEGQAEMRGELRELARRAGAG